VGWGGLILRTVDGGASWKIVLSGITFAVNSVCFSDSLHWWAVGHGGTVLCSQDGGQHWSVQVKGDRNTFPLYGVSFSDSLHGLAAGKAYLIRTEDGGLTWHSLSRKFPDTWQNVVATKKGTVDPSKTYIVCAHFDDISEQFSTWAPGADDDASGTSVVLETAKILKDFPFLASIKFICFSGEEQGLLGSTHYAAEAELAVENIGAVLSFDMVGYGSLPMRLAGLRTRDDLISDYCLAVRDSFVAGFEVVKYFDTMGLSDYASFSDEGYSAICVIETFNPRNPNCHKTSDTVGTLTIPLIADVTRLAVATTASFAGLDTSRMPGPPVPPVVSEMLLAGGFPNPFEQSTHVEFALPAMESHARYTLAILDPSGRVVKVLEEGRTGGAAIEKEVVWAGTDNRGKRVAPGVYLCSLSCNGESRVRKIVFIR